MTMLQFENVDLSVGSRGGKTGVERTIVKGEPFPPTLQKGQSYIMNDLTKIK